MSKAKKTYSFTLEERQERDTVGGTGTTSEPTGRQLPVMIEVEVDLDAIARQLVHRAVRSKSGKCQYMEGKVKVKVIGTKPVLLIKKPKEPAAPPVRKAPSASVRSVDLS